MTYKKQESNSEKGAAYPDVEKCRAKLAEVQTQARAIEDRLREILETKRNQEARAGDIMYQAEALLEGGAETLPARDFDAELRALMRQREVIQKALTIQAGRLDEAVRLASSEAYRRLKPRYISEIKKMILGVEAIEGAFAGMQAIKSEMTGAGLLDISPNVAWPGLNPGGFQRQRETFEYSLKQQGLSEALKIGRRKAKMEKAQLGMRGGNRNQLTVSHEAWDKAGRPDGWIFDHRTKRGRLLTPEERQAAARAGRRAELRLARDPKHLRAKLEAHRAALKD